jgi:hypothetical protein
MFEDTTPWEGQTDGRTGILEFLRLCDIGICYRATDSHVTSAEILLLVF